MIHVIVIKDDINKELIKKYQLLEEISDNAQLSEDKEHILLTERDAQCVEMAEEQIQILLELRRLGK